MSAAHSIDELLVIRVILTKYTGLAYIQPINKAHREYVYGLLNYHYKKFYSSSIKNDLPHKLEDVNGIKSRYKIIKDIDVTMGLIYQYFNSGMWSREKEMGLNISSPIDDTQDFTYVCWKGYNILYVRDAPSVSEHDLTIKNKIIKHTRIFFRIKKRVFENKWKSKSNMLMSSIDFFLEN